MDLEKWIDKTFKLRPPRGSNVRHVHFEWNKIDDLIYLGTNACCQFHFDKELLFENVKADISLESEMIDMAQGIDAFLWLPTADHTAPTIDNLELGVDTIKICIEQGKKIYIHCKNGHGRGPTLLAAYYINHGLTVDDAVKFITTRRREVHIEPIQIEMLQMYAKMQKINEIS